MRTLEIIADKPTKIIKKMGGRKTREKREVKDKWKTFVQNKNGT